MTHNELLEEINTVEYPWWMQDALRAIVELHSPFDGYCQRCTVNNWGETRQEYPCDEIQIIEKELR